MLAVAFVLAVENVWVMVQYVSVEAFVAVLAFVVAVVVVAVVVVAAYMLVLLLVSLQLEQEQQQVHVRVRSLVLPTVTHRLPEMQGGRYRKVGNVKD